MSNVVDLIDEEEMLEEINPDELVVDIDVEKEEEEEGKKKKIHKQKKLSKEAQKKLDDEEFLKIYHKIGGIQHIICSATMTID